MDAWRIAHRCKQNKEMYTTSKITHHCIGVGSNSILGGPNVIYTAIVAICATCMNINNVSRVKYWGGGGGGSLKVRCANRLGT